MKIKVSGVAFAMAITWALIVFAVGFVNFFFAGYGVKFLSLMQSIYPGYTLGKWGFIGVLVATGYAFVEALIVGFVFGIIYNIFAKKQ
jgi:hypothetical protein